RVLAAGRVGTGGAARPASEPPLPPIPPAGSRVKLLAAEPPASSGAGDLLALGAEDLRALPLDARRERLGPGLAGAPPPIHLSPATRARPLAAAWLRPFDAAAPPGAMGTRLSAPYRAAEPTLPEIKHAPAP